MKIKLLFSLNSVQLVFKQYINAAAEDFIGRHCITLVNLADLCNLTS